MLSHHISTIDQARTPRPIVNKVAADVLEVLELPDIICNHQRLEAASRRRLEARIEYSA
jgi:hypothetical protein